eukprot:scaffold54538_cov41-Prasinocladus_malaysianus.AAC.1
MNDKGHVKPRYPDSNASTESEAEEPGVTKPNRRTHFSMDDEEEDTITVSFDDSQSSWTDTSRQNARIGASAH